MPTFACERFRSARVDNLPKVLTDVGRYAASAAPDGTAVPAAEALAR